MDARQYDNTKITAWRKETGISQEALAHELNVHRATIFRAERGLVASYGLLARIASHFRKPVTDLLRETPLDHFPEMASDVPEAAVA